MAGDWIKMRTNLWDDPRVARLCDLTDQGEAAVIGGLYWLWATADEHTEDGLLHGMTCKAIDRKTGVPGLGAALCAVGWLEEGPEGVRILGFEEHNGASAKKRATTAKRVASYRGNADVTPEEEAGNSAVTQAALQNEHASVTPALAREEKRREEKEDMAKTGCADLSPSSPADANSVQTSPLVDECPQQAIVALFHECVPTARRVRDWTPSRAALLRTRWREDRRRQSLDWWRRFFCYVGESPFLTGKANTPGRRPFELGLEWLLKPENFAKVREGAYHEQMQEVTA